MKLTLIFLCCFIAYSIFTYKTTLNKKIHEISIYSCNCLKGLMAISVVLHHLSQGRNIFIFQELFKPFGAIAVGCFFFISGYGLYTSYLMKGQSYLNGYLLKRFRKLIVPFLFVILLYQFINPESHKNILEGIAIGNTTYLLPFSWYIFCAILFYFAFYYIFKYITNKRIKILTTFIITLALWFTIKCILKWPGYWYCSLFLFPIGILFKYNEKYLKNKPSSYIIMESLLIGILIITLHFQNIRHTESLEICLESIAIILPLTILNISSKYLIFLGSISYEIYLVQGIVFYILKTLGINKDIPFILLSIILIILMAYIVKYILNYIDRKLFKI